ncbi:MAG: membrane protein insertion efficiency factor YidD [Candidatus Acidiferrales bacterium]
MGHCDSSTQHGRDGEFLSADRGSVEIAPARAVQRKAHGLSENLKSVGVWFLLGFVRCYQIFLGPFLGGACKFYPSCSNYAYQAIERHGAKRGFLLAIKRLGRCRPFTKGGFDPVPDSIEENREEINLRGRERVQ